MNGHHDGVCVRLPSEWVITIRALCWTGQTPYVTRSPATEARS
jgi:hypothetical protein